MESKRYYAIDQLRAAMILVVMFGHGMLPYITVPRRYKDPETHVAFDVVVLFLYGFAMPLFFVTAGFAAAALLNRRGIRGLISNRFRTIFLPFLIAYLLLSPLIRGAYRFAAEVSRSGSLDAGIEVLLAGEWLRWGAAYHLWFLGALLIYTGLALVLRSLAHSLPDSVVVSASASARTLVDSQLRIVLLSVLASATLIPAYIYNDGGGESVPMQLHLISFFLVGWVFFIHRAHIDRLKDGAWRAMAIAIACLPIAAWSARQRWLAPDSVDLTFGVIAGLSNGIMVAAMSYGLLGLFQRRYDHRPSPAGQYISDASYWIFLIHFPLLILVSGVLSAVSLPAVVKYLVTVGIVAPIVFASYHFLVRNALLGLLLKGRARSASSTRLR